jgi:PAS domain S-box-containing protein
MVLPNSSRIGDTVSETSCLERELAERERERLAREQLLRAARLRLAAIVESSSDAIIGKDLDGIITDWNKGAERIYGYTAEEMIGKSVSILTHPEQPDEISQIMERIRRGEQVEHYETVRVTKAGKPIPSTQMLFRSPEKQEPCQKPSAFVFCSMRAEERENKNYWEGVGKICTSKLTYQRHPYLSPEAPRPQPLPRSFRGTLTAPLGGFE